MTYKEKSTPGILIFDKSSEDAELTKKQIRNEFKESKIQTASSKEDFIIFLDTLKPDVIISECNSSDFCYQAMQNLVEEKLPSTPIIILTSESNEDKALECMASGAKDYVIKEHIKRLGQCVLKRLEENIIAFNLSSAEQDLKEYEKYVESYRSREENVPGMVYQFVMFPDGDTSFIYVSSASRNLIGCEPEEITKDINTLYKNAFPEDLVKFKKVIARSAQKLEPFKFVIRYNKGDQIKWHEFRATPNLQPYGNIIWDGIMLDITEQKKAEEAFETEHQLIRTLIDNIPDTIYFKDLESRFIKINKGYLQKFGLTSHDEVLGKTDFDLFSSEHADEARKDELEIITTGKPIIGKVEKETWNSGKITWVSTTKIPLTNNDGKVIGTFGMSRDITDLKSIEETLAAERNLMRTLIDALPDRIHVKDINCRFILNNAAHLKALGAKIQAEVKGKTDFDFRPKEIAGKYNKDDRKVLLTGKPLTVEEETADRLGNLVGWHISTKVPMRDTNGKISGLVGISHDITVRKKQQQKLEASEAQLKNALKVAKFAYWEYDVLSDEFTFNDQFYSLYRTTAVKEGGYKMSSKQYVERFLLPDGSSVVGNEIQKAIQTKDTNYSSHLEHPMIYADGEEGYISVSFFIEKNEEGVTVRSYGMDQDITERKKAELALKQSEYILRKSQSAANIGSFIWDLKSGKWETSSALDNILGIDGVYQKDLRGWLSIIHPEDQKEINEYLKKQVMEKHNKFDKEYRIIRNNDKVEKWVLGLGDIEFDDKGKAKSIVGTIQDITQRIQRDQEKHELEKQVRLRNEELEKMVHDLKHMQGSLVQSEKMASLGQLTAGIAHEINNPLAFVSSNVNRLNEYFQDVLELINYWQEFGNSLSNNSELQPAIKDIEKHAEEIDLDFIIEDFITMMKSIQDGTERIKKIVEGLRGFAHMSDASFSKAFINQAIEDTLTIVWNELKYKATIEKEYGELPEITCNIGEIKQVFVNFFVNAAHSIKEKGIIKIATLVEGDYILIKISDTGCGIPKESLKRIFDPFYTTKAVGKGTGLGLWISSSIIEKHSGFLTVESEINVGTTFIIKLPINQKSIAE